DYFVPHQPNGKFPVRVAKLLGFEHSKVAPGLITPMIGNTYSGSSIIGLAAVLDVAKPGDRILLVSYGSGAGSDAFSIKVTKEITEKGRRQEVAVMEQIKEKAYVNYAVYAKHRKKLKSGE
ncbi:MAG: hydroxymethylglutaryl-CoA synthase, partial [Candidatus Micrarchaeota archaeon]